MVKLIIMFSFKHMKYYHLEGDVHECNMCTYVYSMYVLLDLDLDN